MDDTGAKVLHSIIWGVVCVVVALGMTAMITHMENLKTAGQVMIAQPVGVKK